MKLLIAIFFILSTTISFSQNNAYYVSIPISLKEGTISYYLHADFKDSTFMIIISGLSKNLKDAGYFFTCEREFKKIDKNAFNSSNMLNPQQIMDSLEQTGRPFFRNNTFYILFIRGENYYVHKAIGEYIFMDYRNE